ncbi:MBL fold metallo-hydrolase [Pseudonocardia nigra]|uniref:MBL fold metallo-hydrolase n=1 Tax=Pseudonocardia nigra TaxID=1921578 RepID=UPI001C60212E|nr:MBL fold metallo-hydrolase [Pseudonocardia nigra]
MCDVLGRALRQADAAGGLSRRGFLRAAGATAVAGGLMASAGCAASAEEPRRAATAASGHRTRLVLLGTAGGPILLKGGDRFGVSTAIAYGGRVYVVDLGLGAQMRLAAAGFGGEAPNSQLAGLRGVFFTHLHSDHVAEWPALYAVGPMNRGSAREKIHVFGPGDRGTLPRVFPPHRPEPALVNADNPTPGISGMTAHLRNAFATDFNDRARDSNYTLPEGTFDVQDIDIAPYWQVDPAGVPPRLHEPIPVWQDGDVRVTATLVDHHPTAPAFAFRFDTPDGSVVVSGDTAVSENLIDLARGADHLVHEVIDPEFVEQLVQSLPREQQDPLRAHLLESHTTIEQVGRDVAEPAGVKTLVLNHLVPGDNDPERWKQAQNGFSGTLIVGEDLMQLGVGQA